MNKYSKDPFMGFKDKNNNEFFWAPVTKEEKEKVKLRRSIRTKNKKK